MIDASLMRLQIDFAMRLQKLRFPFLPPSHRLVGFLFLYMDAFWVGVCAMDQKGCTNNNYASREMCKKCGQPKALAAMPAITMRGASPQTHQHYLSRIQGGNSKTKDFSASGLKLLVEEHSIPESKFEIRADVVAFLWLYTSI
ncbi:hypothetical protein L2E82_47697 [Cichorium intybus]|uniref:Uncharacterized protein n=1 Tax=Cichorium intybus TaxID=13427 RepID=A0ACB8YWX8_CICIN|nr:hypothetical protein L2E82_47697 [Cichorium intybus]